MKQTFKNKYLDWALIVLTSLLTVETIVKLFAGFDFFSSFLIRILFAAVSIAGLLSLLLKKANGERYSKFFILIVLIYPGVFVFNLFLTNWFFYGIQRLNLLENDTLYLKLVLGIALLAATTKYSRQQASGRQKDYGVLISYTAVFLIFLILARAIEAHFNREINPVPIWETLIKTGLASLIGYLGYQLKNDKMRLTKGVIFTLVLMSIYALI